MSKTPAVRLVLHCQTDRQMEQEEEDGWTDGRAGGWMGGRRGGRGMTHIAKLGVFIVKKCPNWRASGSATAPRWYPPPCPCPSPPSPLSLLLLSPATTSLIPSSFTSQFLRGKTSSLPRLLSVPPFFTSNLPDSPFSPHFYSSFQIFLNLKNNHLPSVVLGVCEAGRRQQFIT